MVSLNSCVCPRAIFVIIMAENFVLKPVPMKDGDAIADYVKYFRSVVDCNGWSDNAAASIFTPLLGVGSHWFNDVSEADLKSFDAILKALVGHQAPIREAKCAELVVSTL